MRLIITPITVARVMPITTSIRRSSIAVIQTTAAEKEVKYENLLKRVAMVMFHLNIKHQRQNTRQMKETVKGK